MKTKVKLVMTILISTLFLSSCALPGLVSNKDKSVITIAGGITSEDQILANIVSDMIQHYTKDQVTIINNLATPTISHQAMLNGDAQISSTRYTGTDLTATLNMEPTKDAKSALKTVKHEFEKRYHQQWFDSYGYANTYTFMVTKETAKKYNLKKVSDLKKISQTIRVGVDTYWMNRKGDGYEDFSKAYGFGFDHIYPMQIGLVYDAVEAGKMDVVLGYSTDGRINSYGLVMLEDDLHFFPPYDASLVATDKLLKERPEIKPVLDRLVGTISTQQMQKMNYEADNNLQEPATVAKKFLEEHNYFEAKGSEK
ncbi:osmoprotectant ABC transporter substrate-binding protein [Vagococcus vulneris]|uniref:osmoprotectant ABC transporter substrate-binding protein n=1 Tax=Vagococcus vulneris TaxID=1977869 RepID=UPI0023E864EA|nr:osmoprotectant ABC transporter substrate-binding protein [Vagococcus vulneris]